MQVRGYVLVSFEEASAHPQLLGAADNVCPKEMEEDEAHRLKRSIAEPNANSAGTCAQREALLLFYS